MADAIVGAKNLDNAYHALSAAILRNFVCESLLFAMRAGVWVRIAGNVGGSRERAWRDALDRLADSESSVMRVDIPGDGVATVIRVPHDDALAIVLENDWTTSHDLLASCARVIGITLYAVEQRDANRRASRVVRSIYRVARRAATKSNGQLLKQIVDQLAAAFAARRVSIARYDAADNCLRIAAAYGTPMSIAQEVKIAPGDWILGHVYSTGKALSIKDVGALPSARSNQGRYESRSFLAVPLVHRGETLGVLSITDKRDGRAFDAAEQIALKTVANVIAAALHAEDTRAQVERLEHVASIDAVTGLLNRAYFDTRLQQEVSRSEREGTQLAVLMADLDAFKSINDSRGHQIGDTVLKQVAEIIRSSVRLFDVCARWGGDEFAILMPRCDSASATACAERIRSRTADALKEMRRDGSPISLSIGVVVGAPGDSAFDLIARADHALYEAKSRGKDCVSVYSTPPAEPGDEHQAPTDLGMVKGARQLPYIVVADASRERAEAYKAAADQFQLGLLRVTNGDQALNAISQFGPPVLLAVDVTDRKMRGLSVIEAARSRGDRSAVIAISDSREVRLYLPSLGSTRRVDVLRPEVSAAQLRSVVDRALRQEETPLTVAVATAHKTHAIAEHTEATLAAVAESSVAVDVADEFDEDLRVSVTLRQQPAVAPGATWIFDDPGPASGTIPAAIEETGRRRGDSVALSKITPRATATDAAIPIDWAPTLLERRLGEFEVDRELARARRQQSELSVVLFEVSPKGHANAAAATQDPMFEGVAETLIRGVRQSDLPIQWDANELLLVLPGLSGSEARRVAERVRAAMQAGGRQRFAIAGGVAELGMNEQFTTVVNRARAQADLARGRGHNRVG